MFHRFRKDHSRELANSGSPRPAEVPGDQQVPAADQGARGDEKPENSSAGQQPEPVYCSPEDPSPPSDVPVEQPDDRVDNQEPEPDLDDQSDDPRQPEIDDPDVLDNDQADAELPDEFPDAVAYQPVWTVGKLPPPIGTPCPRHTFNRGVGQLAQVGKGSTKQRVTYTPQQRLLLLDTWQRSGLPAGEFSDLVGLSKHTLYQWKKRFEKQGPEGLMDQPKGQQRRGSRLPEVTRRTILMVKSAHPEWGVERIADMLMRGPALSASPSAIARVLHEAGYQSVSHPTEPHRPPKVKTFERARPNQLWQTDLFTFLLKRQNRRLYLVAFIDDHSRFIVSFGLHASATTPLVIEALEAGIANYGPPEEILTDNGPQFVTWRGKSRFSRHLEHRGIKQIVARPKRPQTLGKIERFWGTMWRELLKGSVFIDLSDARNRIGHFIDYYNFQRPHRGIDGLVPADRFFGAAQSVLQTLKQRVAGNALELARHGALKAPFYVTGQVSGQQFSVHSEGERLVLSREGQQREEIQLVPGPNQIDAQPPVMPQPVCPQGIVSSLPGEPAETDPPAPGQSAIDRLSDFDSDEKGVQR